MQAQLIIVAINLQPNCSDAGQQNQGQQRPSLLYRKGFSARDRMDLNAPNSSRIRYSSNQQVLVVINVMNGRDE